MILTSRMTNHRRRRRSVRFGSPASSRPPLSTTVVTAPPTLLSLLFAAPASSELHSQQPNSGSKLHTSAPRMDPVVPLAARAIAAAAAEAAVQEVLTDPSSETMHAVSLASAAAAAATAVHFCSASRAPTREPSMLPPGRPPQSTEHHAGRPAAPTTDQTGPYLRPASLPRQASRKTKVTLTLGYKIDLIRMSDSGVHSWRSL